MEIRKLTQGDERRLERFLRSHADASMLLRSNLRVAGLVDRGERYQGTYVASLASGRITGVVALYWNDTLIPQAPCALIPRLTRAVVRAAGRPVRRAVGPRDQVDSALATLRIGAADLSADEAEGLFAVPLSQLRRPDVLNAQRVCGRLACEQDRELLLPWLEAFDVEALSQPPSKKLRSDNEAYLEHTLAEGTRFVLLRDGVPVATSAFNARLPDAVQIGGVYTPPTERGKGFARGVVAYSLGLARERGVERAVLFTGDRNAPAIQAYRALGFQRVGDFRLAFFD